MASEESCAGADKVPDDTTGLECASCHDPGDPSSLAGAVG
jgi:hypothetical protein